MPSRLARIPANMVVPLAPPSPTTRIPNELLAVGAAAAAAAAAGSPPLVMVGFLVFVCGELAALLGLENAVARLGANWLCRNTLDVVLKPLTDEPTSDTAEVFGDGHIDRFQRANTQAFLRSLGYTCYTFALCVIYCCMWVIFRLVLVESKVKRQEKYRITSNQQQATSKQETCNHQPSISQSSRAHFLQ
jgi:hypothetical protein